MPTGSVGAVLVTGCSSGIGRATAARLVAHGQLVYATARKLDSIADLAADGCRILTLDVTDEDSRSAAVDVVVAEQGSIGALINNAGYSQSGALETLDLEVVRQQFETNVFGLLRMCQLVLPSMRREGRGRIVNVSSMGGTFTFPGAGAYHSSKYAVEALSDALRFEVAGFGVAVTVIQPGIIQTGFGDRVTADMPAVHDGPYATFNARVAEVTRQVYEQGPLARLGGGPETVAKAIEDALVARRAPVRVKVTPSARVLIALRRLLPDRGWDAFVGSQFLRPGTENPILED